MKTKKFNWVRFYIGFLGGGTLIYVAFKENPLLGAITAGIIIGLIVQDE